MNLKYFQSSRTFESISFFSQNSLSRRKRYVLYEKCISYSKSRLFSQSKDYGRLQLDLACELDKELHRRTELSRVIGSFQTELTLHSHSKASLSFRKPNSQIKWTIKFSAFCPLLISHIPNLPLVCL